jgi:limonene-1,2-epoxide hydrolase
MRSMTGRSIGRRGVLIAGGMGLVGSAITGSAEAAAWTPTEWGPAEKASVKIVNDFLAALDAGNLDAHLALLADDAKVRNLAHTPAAPVNPEGLRKILANFLKPGAVRVKTLDTIALGPMVINTRIDRITSVNGVTDMYYMGVFFVKDGKIKEWSDYEVAPSTPVKPGQLF